MYKQSTGSTERLVWHSKCQTCLGTRKISCVQCSAGYSLKNFGEMCEYCGGAGKIDCTECKSKNY
jgi:hypothetical protein